MKESIGTPQFKTILKQIYTHIKTILKQFIPTAKVDDMDNLTKKVAQ